MDKSIFLRMSSWSQLFFLFLFIFCGLIFGSLITIIVNGGSVEDMQSINNMRIAQLIQSVCLFLLPALICAFLFNEHPVQFLKIKKKINLKFLLLSILLILTIQPLINFIGYYNNQIVLPESLASIERWMKHMEEAAQTMLNQILTTNSLSIFALNIFIIAIMAGVTEEFIFRGVLQQIFRRITQNGHCSVWITAFIFSFIHFQFYGFFPRLLLGAILGYLFLWSGNLWIPVIIHAINNFIAILIVHFFLGTSTYNKLEVIGTGDTLWITIISIILSGGISYLLVKEYPKNNPQEYYN